ncbi:hypothetical protein [Thalassolituus sp.]|jgi:hypothetical protein|uniref:hypothetical protein n=1 Tax=Thalassolituus sp. TaxID=2030822 RepID=UPI002A7FF537|nr:hypothetical protein [Thalassolituus sp.]
MRFSLLLVLSLMMSVARAGDLSDDQVNNWVSSMPALQSWLDKHEDQLPKEDMMKKGVASVDEMFTQGIAQLQKAGLYGEFSKLVKTQSFDSVEAWSEISKKITMAYMAISMEGEAVDVKQIEAQIEQLKASALPEEQKQMMENMLQASMNMINSLGTISAADKEAVRPYLTKITSHFDQDH